MKVTLDLAGLAAVCNETQARTVQRERAQEAVEAVKRDGPRAQHGGQHIVDKIAVGETRTTPDGAATSILWASPFWHFVEYGTVNMPPSRVLTRSAQNAGLRVVDRGAA